MSNLAYLAPVSAARAALSAADKEVEAARWKADSELREATDNLAAAKARLRDAKRIQRKTEAAWYATEGSKAVSAACSLSFKLEREAKERDSANSAVVVAA